MNITTQEECIEKWEKDLSDTDADPTIPQEDKSRVLHELDELYSLAYNHLIRIGHTPQSIQTALDKQNDL